MWKKFIRVSTGLAQDSVDGDPDESRYGTDVRDGTGNSREP